MSISCSVVNNDRSSRDVGLIHRTAVIIPAFNEGKHLPDLIERCARIEPAMILVVDDASDDETPRVLAAAQRRYAALQYLRNEANRGKQGSVQRGLRWLAACPEIEAVALIDGDGQHDPAELPPLVALLTEHDAVIGARRQDEMPLQRRISNGLVNIGFLLIGGVDFVDVQSGLRVYRKRFADVLAEQLPAEGGYGLEHESLSVLARFCQSNGIELRVAAAAVSCAYGAAESKMQLGTYFQLAFETIRQARRIRRACRRSS